MAASVHMSASSFHQRFKSVTTMSPLQYQKALRLHEARRLMLFQQMDASDACHRVGYLSPSQRCCALTLAVDHDAVTTCRAPGTQGG
jgi:AraC-like DNA-binding protein